MLTDCPLESVFACYVFFKNTSPLPITSSNERGVVHTANCSASSILEMLFTYSAWCAAIWHCETTGPRDVAVARLGCAAAVKQDCVYHAVMSTHTCFTGWSVHFHCCFVPYTYITLLVSSVNEFFSIHLCMQYIYQTLLYLNLWYIGAVTFTIFLRVGIHKICYIAVCLYTCIMLSIHVWTCESAELYSLARPDVQLRNTILYIMYMRKDECKVYWMR